MDIVILCGYLREKIMLHPASQLQLAEIKRWPQDSAVGTETCYGLAGSGFEPQWGARVPAPIHTCPKTYLPSYSITTGALVLGHDLDHCPPPPPSSSEIKERAQLYLYLLTVPSWDVTG